MKKIVVNGSCIGCGLCTASCEYLVENAEGNAEAVIGKVISNEDLSRIKEIVKECPSSALNIVEIKSDGKKGKEAVKDIIKMIENKANEFSVKEITGSDIPLNVDDYDIPVPWSRKEYNRFSSERAARNAAKDEFYSLCYSQSAYRPMLKKVFVEYKINKLRPFYTLEDNDSSFYYSYNQKIREFLADIYIKICDALGDSNSISEEWKKFDMPLSKKDFAIEAFDYYDSRSTQSGIMEEFKSRGEYTSIDWYVDMMDFDFDEMYAGEGLFGRTKTKNEWYFTGFHSAAKDFVDDLKHAINMVSDEIEEGAAGFANSAIGSYNERVKKELKNKAAELKKYINV